MSDSAKQRPKRSKKSNQNSVNDIAVNLNIENLDGYERSCSHKPGNYDCIDCRNQIERIYSICTDFKNPSYCDIDKLRELCNGSTVSLNHILGDNGETVLFNAAFVKDDERCIDLVKFLIEEMGLQANAEDMLQQTVLYYMCREGKANCIEYLISQGCALNHTDIYKQTPLYYAVRHDQKETVLKCLELCGSEESAKEYINHKDVENETCLFYAAIEGHVEMAKILIERGAEYQIENKLGQTVLDICLQSSAKNPTPYQAQMIEYLKEIGTHQGQSSAKKQKKKSGRPANIHTKKTYALCVKNDDGWAVATGETEQEKELFEKLHDPKWVAEAVFKASQQNNDE